MECALRFRCHIRTLPGWSDISRECIGIFVDGDFWHGWRLPAWEHKLTPFRRDKLRARARVHRNFRRLPIFTQSVLFYKE